MQPTATTPPRTFADSIGKDPSWMQDWSAANAQPAQSPYAEIERTLWKDTHGDNLIAGANAAGSSSGKGRLSAEEIALATKYFNDSTAGNPSTSSDVTRKLSASGLSPSPFVDGARMTPGPVSSVGGFDCNGNSINGAQFDLGRTWVGDVVKAPLNFATNTVELVGNNLNLSFTLPGDPSYIPFMQSMKLPYSTEAGSYAEFGLGILAGGATAWARAPELAASEIAGTALRSASPTISTERGVAFFGRDNLRYYAGDTATSAPPLGAAGRPFFMMPIEDSSVVTNPVSAAIESGFAPSAQRVWNNGGDLFGVSVPLEGLTPRLPTTADAMGWPHFLKGGNTAVNIPNTDWFMVNKTREFVIDGGAPIPKGSVVFRVGDHGEQIPLWKH